MREHLTLVQLEGYARRTLGPSDLLAADRHLAHCSACRERLEQPQDLTRLAAILTEHLRDAARVPRHLTYEEMAGYVDGDLSGADREVAEVHLGDCAACSGAAQDLASFRPALAAATPAARVRSANSWRRAAVLVPLAAAAVIVVWLAASAGRPPAIAPRRASGPSPTASPPAVAPALVVSLRDGSREVKLDAAGRLEGLPALPPDREAMVRAALTRAELPIPPRVAELAGRAGTLLGSPQDGVPFVLVGPVATAVESTRPTFRWKPLPGAARYTVSVFDPEYRPVAVSPALAALEWTSSVALTRGRTYAWQVSADRGGHEVVSPTAPAPEARFEVLERSQMERLRRARSETAGSRLLLALINAEAGLMEDAERELQGLMADNRGAELPRRLLHALDSR